MSRPRSLKIWLSKQRNGQFMLSYHRPVWHVVGSTNEVDCYIQPGDPVAYRHLCSFVVGALFGVTALPLGESIQVTLTGGVAEEPPPV